MQNVKSPGLRAAPSDSDGPHGELALLTVETVLASPPNDHQNMQTVQLGKSSLTCSRLAYGCWRIAGNPDGGKTSPEAEAHGRKAVIAAYGYGYTIFDLADIYGESTAERIFGQALKEVSAMRL